MSNATQPQYREVKRKANAGERIKIVAAACTGGLYNNGDELVVDSVESTGVYAKHTNGRGAGIWHREYVVLEPIALNLPDLFAQFIRDNAGAVRSYLAEIDPVESAEPNVEESASEPPLTRAKVIKMARERVAELERIGRGRGVALEGSVRFRTTYYAIDFAVNREKRVVTALIFRLNGADGTYKRAEHKPAAVGIAKCAPDDVFNADIGKAIAAERALGLTLTPEFVNAPKPAEPTVGMTVGFYDDEAEYLRMTVSEVSREKLRGTVDGTKGFVWRNAAHRHGGSCTDPVIIDDTDAVYTQEGRESA